MPAPDLRPPVAHPILTLRAAVTWARAAGHHVRLGSYGVICVSQEHPRWAKDPETRGLSPIGAAVLAAQPDTDDLELAVTEALGWPAAWAAGMEAGLNHEQPPADWSHPIHRQLMLRGYEAGTRYRAELLRSPLRAVQ